MTLPAPLPTAAPGSEPLAGDEADEALFARYAVGDRDAFIALFERWSPVVTGIVRRAGFEGAERDELVQEVFLRLHRSRADFREGERVAPWILTIAMNTRRDAVRRRVHRPGPVDADLPGEDPDPAIGDRLDVGAALRRLQADQREVIELHWFGGLTFPQIAESVGATLAAVKVRAHRGYSVLRVRLGGGP